MTVETMTLKIEREPLTYLYQLLEYETCYCLSVWCGNKNVSARKFDTYEEAASCRDTLMENGEV